ncbi:MAG: hypothetical protein NT007_06190 [Candidatus Kapabacteria bacterium]|nr:hypothetical protein [Candidatus Kapabacteria bacterium]
MRGNDKLCPLGDSRMRGNDKLCPLGDSRIRGNDNNKEFSHNFAYRIAPKCYWKEIPACAGMTAIILVYTTIHISSSFFI